MTDSAPDTRTDWEDALRAFLDQSNSDLPAPPVASCATVRRVRGARTSDAERPLVDVSA